MFARGDESEQNARACEQTPHIITTTATMMMTIYSVNTKIITIIVKETLMYN